MPTPDKRPVSNVNKRQNCVTRTAWTKMVVRWTPSGSKTCRSGLVRPLWNQQKTPGIDSASVTLWRRLNLRVKGSCDTPTRRPTWNDMTNTNDTNSEFPQKQTYKNLQYPTTSGLLWERSLVPISRITVSGAVRQMTERSRSRSELTVRPPIPNKWIFALPLRPRFSSTRGSKYTERWFLSKRTKEWPNMRTFGAKKSII